MNLKERIDRNFFITDEEIEEGYEVHWSSYLWVLLYIVAGLFTMLIAINALAQMQ